MDLASLEFWANVVGVAGMILVVLAYVLLQLHRIDAHGLLFNLVNLGGALLLLASLCVHFNLASFIIELFWISASLLGLYKWHKGRNAKNGH